MDLGDAAEALRATAELAKRHAEALRRQAHEQREMARAQREAEARAVEAARGAVPLEGELLRCARCNATWRREAILEATRRQPSCLLCGGSLTPVP
jgi:NAD-dependent SIR2 family protein deacetylase